MKEAFSLNVGQLSSLLTLLSGMEDPMLKFSFWVVSAVFDSNNSFDIIGICLFSDF